MNRKKIIAITVVLAVVGIGIALLYRLGFFPRGSFESSLRNTIRESKGKEFNLAGITCFRWDHLYILPPYSDPMKIQISKTRTIKSLNWNTVDEGNCLLVFMQNEAVVYESMFNRRYGDFAMLFREEGYTPSDARFRVPNKNEYWAKLEWVKQ
jgi:hypothetical protein